MFLVNHNVFVCQNVSIDNTTLRLGEDVRVSLLGVPVWSEEPGSFAAEVTATNVRVVILVQIAELLGAGKEYCFELRKKPWNSVHSIVHLSLQQVWKLK